jgi:type III pantothenate kinase
MDLIIDIGNSRAKLAFLHNKEIHSFAAVKLSDLYNTVKQVLEDNKPVHSIVASVVQTDTGLLDLLKEKTELIIFSSTTFKGLDNHYRTVHTLGADRLAAVAGASRAFSMSNCLVINAGTCITYDFVTANKAYLGGGISPGLSMRFRALNEFTDKLPLIAIDDDFSILIGASTDECILSGVQNGFISEIIGMIARYKTGFDNLTVIVSGGDADFIAKKLREKNIELYVRPNLVLEGLATVLGY